MDSIWFRHPHTTEIVQSFVNGYNDYYRAQYSSPFKIEGGVEWIEFPSTMGWQFSRMITKRISELPSGERRALLSSLPHTVKAVEDILEKETVPRREVSRTERVLLHPNEALLRFIRREDMYFVSVDTSDGAASEIELFEADYFEIFVELMLRNYTRRHSSATLDSLDSWLDSFLNTVYNATFDKVSSLLGGVDTIYWIGEGHFNFVPLDLVFAQCRKPDFSEVILLSQIRDVSSLGKSDSLNWKERGG